MAEIRVCDICGSRIESSIDGQRFRVQKESFLCRDKWKTIDICDNCFMQIRQRSIEANVDKERS